MVETRAQLPEVSRAGLEALRDKYREIERLRRAQDAGATPEPPRRAMAALAARFPGALRELDELPPDALQRRLAALEGALDGSLPAPAWAPIQLAYHGLLRTCLRAKRLVGSGRDHESVAAELRAADPQPGEPGRDSLTAAFVGEAVRPPGGRLNPWVFTRVAEQLDLDSPDAVRAALFER